MIAMSLALMGTTLLILLPEEDYPGGWLWWHLFIYNLVFIVITNFGVFGAYLMSSALLWPYAICMLVVISLNFVTWIFMPDYALMDLPVDVIAATSMFDLTAMLGAFYLVYRINAERNSCRVTPIKIVIDDSDLNGVKVIETKKGYDDIINEKF